MEKSDLGILSNETENHFLCSPTKLPFFPANGHRRCAASDLTQTTLVDLCAAVHGFELERTL